MSTPAQNVSYLDQHTFHDVAIQMANVVDDTLLSPELFALVQHEVVLDLPFLSQVIDYPMVALECLIAKIKDLALYLFGLEFTVQAEIKDIKEEFKKTSSPHRQVELMGRMALIGKSEGINVEQNLVWMKGQLQESDQTFLNEIDFEVDKITAVLIIAAQKASFIRKSLNRAAACQNWGRYLKALSLIDISEPSFEVPISHAKRLEYWKRLPQEMQAYSRVYFGPIEVNSIPTSAIALEARLPSTLLNRAKQVVEDSSASEVDKLHALHELAQKSITDFEYFQSDMTYATLAPKFLELVMKLQVTTQDALLDRVKEVLTVIDPGSDAFCETADPQSREIQHLTFKRAILKLFHPHPQEEMLVMAVKQAFSTTEL